MNVASFVLGLVSVLGGVVLCGIPPILGIVFGIVGISRKEDNKGLGIAGIVLSGLSILGVCCFYIFFGAVGFLGALAGNY